MIYFPYESKYEVYREEPVTIFVNENSEPLFCAFEVAKLAGYKAFWQVVHDKKLPSKINIEYHDGSKIHNVAFISQEDVYEIIKKRVANPEQFIIDILNGRIPSIH